MLKNIQTTKIFNKISEGITLLLCTKEYTLDLRIFRLQLIKTIVYDTSKQLGETLLENNSSQLCVQNANCAILHYTQVNTLQLTNEVRHFH